jgi:hypothetical protein
MTSYVSNFDPDNKLCGQFFSKRRVIRITLTLTTSNAHNLEPDNELCRYFFTNDKLCI